MNSASVWKLLIVAGIIIASFGILVPPMDSYYQYLSCFGRAIYGQGPCPKPQSYIDLTFFVGIAVFVVGATMAIRTKRQQTEWKEAIEGVTPGPAQPS